MIQRKGKMRFILIEHSAAVRERWQGTDHRRLVHCDLVLHADKEKQELASILKFSVASQRRIERLGDTNKLLT